jgi:hypothetical protein
MKSLTFVVVFFLISLSVNLQADMKKPRFQSVDANKTLLFQTGINKDSCAICGMHLPTFYKTSHTSDTKNGPKQYCSLHCVVADTSFFENLQVIDINSLKYIPVTKAFYVVGSKKPATMSHISKYAFGIKQEAKKFAKEFGGKVIDFDGAYSEAKKDFMQ